MALFESYERRVDKINAVLAEYGINSIEECRAICKEKGFDPYEIVKGVQPIAFENAGWAYCVGAAIAIRKGVKTAAEAAKAIGIGLQSFCIPGSVADDRKVGLGHGNLGAMLLSDDTKCFAFLAGHESFAAAEGAIGIVRNANKARKEPLRVILNGLGKDAAQIISRINGFTYVQTQFDYYTGKLTIVREIPYSKGERAAVRCYGADDVREGVAIMHHEGVDVSITGNSTNPTRFQHPVAGTYKKECIEQGKKYFSVASGGGTGRTLHPDNMAAGPASYGMTDTMGRMHSDAQFAGSSSVPAHVEMMGFLGMGNNPMVGATVAVAVADAEAVRINFLSHKSSLLFRHNNGDVAGSLQDTRVAATGAGAAALHGRAAGDHNLGHIQLGGIHLVVVLGVRAGAAQDLVQQGGAGVRGVLQDALGKLDVLVADQIADDLDLAGRNTREFVFSSCFHQYLSSLLSGSLAAGVAAERAGRHELAQLVTDHVLGDVHADVTAAVMHSEGVTDEGREDRRAAGPGLEDLFLAGFVQFIDSLEQLRSCEGAFLNASAHISFFPPYLALRRLTIILSVGFFFLRVL